MQAVTNVDIPRFIGVWSGDRYVVADIPTFAEKDAFNPLEQYALNADGTVNPTLW